MLYTPHITHTDACQLASARWHPAAPPLPH
jgi:hypothetical protein